MEFMDYILYKMSFFVNQNYDIVFNLQYTPADYGWDHELPELLLYVPDQLQVLSMHILLDEKLFYELLCP